ncbi:hypothetical protein cypCar_00006049 [Cyprinus carpio]|nr:hypothetical protein cypCar_00006049 [Cyprinus carpio]
MHEQQMAGMMASGKEYVGPQKGTESASRRACASAANGGRADEMNGSPRIGTSQPGNGAAVGMQVPAVPVGWLEVAGVAGMVPNAQGTLGRISSIDVS